MNESKYEISTFRQTEEIKNILKGVIKHKNYPYDGEPYSEYSIEFVYFDDGDCDSGDVFEIHRIRKGAIPHSDGVVGYHALKSIGDPDSYRFFPAEKIIKIEAKKEYHFDKKRKRRTRDKPKKRTLTFFFSN